MHAVANAGHSTECRPIVRWESCMRSAHGAVPGQPQSDHRATMEQPWSDHGACHGAIPERPRSGPERHHGAARRSRTERLRGTRAERLRAPPRGAAHGAGTEQLHEAACVGVFVAAQDHENQNHDVPFVVGITVDVGDGRLMQTSITTTSIKD